MIKSRVDYLKSFPSDSEDSHVLMWNILYDAFIPFLEEYFPTLQIDTSPNFNTINLKEYILREGSIHKDIINFSRTGMVYAVEMKVPKRYIEKKIYYWRIKNSIITKGGVYGIDEYGIEIYDSEENIITEIASDWSPTQTIDIKKYKSLDINLDMFDNIPDRYFYSKESKSLKLKRFLKVFSKTLDDLDLEVNRTIDDKNRDSARMTKYKINFGSLFGFKDKQFTNSFEYRMILERFFEAIQYGQTEKAINLISYAFIGSKPEYTNVSNSSWRIFSKVDSWRNPPFFYVFDPNYTNVQKIISIFSKSDLTLRIGIIIKFRSFVKILESDINKELLTLLLDKLLPPVKYYIKYDLDGQNF